MGVILFVVGVLIQGDVPMMNDPVADTQAWFADNGDTYLLGDFIIGIGVVVFLLPFFMILRSVLAAAEGGLGHWSRFAFYGAFLFMLFGGAAAGFMAPLAVLEGEIDDAVVPALTSASFYAYGGLPLALVPFFLGTAMVIKGTNVFWGWVAWTSLALALVALVGACAPVEGDPQGVFSTLGYLSFLGFALTILLLSAGLLTNREPAS
jgi:hypothetical protein